MIFILIGRYEPKSFRVILDEAGIPSLLKGDTLTWKMTKKEKERLESVIDPDDTGWIDPEEIWGKIKG